MARARYLRLDQGRWIWRRRVPKNLVAVLGKTEIIRSIGSVPKADARKQARQLTVASDHLFAMLQRRTDLDEYEIQDLAEYWFNQYLGRIEKIRRAYKPDDYEEHQEFLEKIDKSADAAMEMIVLNDTECTRETVQWLLEQNGLDLPADSQSFRELQHAVLRAFAEAHRINAARYRGNYAVRPQDPLLARAFSSEPRARRQPKPASAQFSDLWQRYVDGKIKAGDWGHDMQRENRMSQSLFTEIAGDRPIDAYERSQISDLVNVLQHLPAMRGKDPRFKGKTSAELMQMTKTDPTIKTMQSKTVKKHFSNISSFFGWCVRQGQLPSNPAEGVYQLKRTKRRQDERAAWTNADLKTWFTCPIYQGSQPHHRLRRGQEVRRDALYWLPILALFHALRLEEGAQLRVEDVQSAEGIWFMHIHATPDEDPGPARKVKSAAGWRRIPIHQTVIALGFLDHVEQQRRKGERRVFPELKPGGTAQRYGYKVSKDFSRYAHQLDLAGATFHGLRHTAITALARAEVYPDTINRLNGHEISGERGRYVKDIPLPQLQAAINAIAYDGIDADLIAGARGASKRRPTPS